MDGLPAHLQRQLASSGLQGGVRHTIQGEASGFLSLHTAIHCMIGREIAAAKLEACDWICVGYPFALLLCPPVLQRLSAVHLQPATLLLQDDRWSTAAAAMLTVRIGGVCTSMLGTSTQCCPGACLTIHGPQAQRTDMICLFWLNRKCAHVYSDAMQQGKDSGFLVTDKLLFCCF